MRYFLRPVQTLIGLVFALAVLHLTSSSAVPADAAAKAPQDTAAKSDKTESPSELDLDLGADEEEPVAPRVHRPASTPEPTDSIPGKIHRYAERLMRQYDRNGDGVLDASEWRKMHGEPQTADADKDGSITVEELAQQIADYGRTRRVRLAVPAIGASDEAKAAPSAEGKAAAKVEGKTPAKTPESSEETAGGAAPGLESMDLEPPRGAKFYVPPHRLPAGLPEWFLLRDADGDGQLSLSEYASKPTSADLAEFRRYDLNGDGLITAQECVRSGHKGKPSRQRPAGR